MTPARAAKSSFEGQQTRLTCDTTLAELLPFANPSIERTIINGWDDASFRDSVLQLGRSQLIFTGVALDVGVTFPAVAASRDGFSVSIPVDAVGATDSRIETAAFMNLASAGVSLTSVQAIGMGLIRDVSSLKAGDLLAILSRAHTKSENPFGDA